MITVEQQALNHLINYHANEDGTYTALSMWSTPTEEIVRRRALGICKHSLSVIYCKYDRGEE